MRQAHQQHVTLGRSEAGLPRVDDAEFRIGSQQSHQGRRDSQDGVRATTPQDRNEACKLQGVTEPLFTQDEDTLAVDGLTAKRFHAEAKQPTHASLPVFLVTETFFEMTE